MLTTLISLYIGSMLNENLILNLEKINFLKNNEISTIENIDFEEINIKSPVKNSYYICPIIKAEGSIAVDINTGEILYEKNSHEKLPIASITKLMTVLIILEENKLNDIVKISNNAANIEGSAMFLRSGEEIAVENLIYGAIIGSANDAAIALAEYNAGSVNAFVEKMNKKAKELELLDTNFSNPVGLDENNNYSSAYDVAKLAKEIYKNEFIRHAAELKELEVKSISGEYVHKLESTNDLLENSYLKIKGLKTGKTDKAGLCLVSIAENGNKNEILTVVLNSPARFTETKILTDWLFRAYKW